MIKVYEDRQKMQAFDKGLDEAVEDCNRLISYFKEFQPFEAVCDIQDFVHLVSDPQQAYDEVLFRHLQLNANAGLKADARQLALLFNLDRDNYLNVVAGKPIKTDCKPCDKVRVKKGQTAISLQVYRYYSKFMTFSGCQFHRNDAAADEHKKSYISYAETPQQVAVVNHFKDLAAMMNKHNAQFRISLTDKQAIARGLHLQLANAFDPDGQFIADSSFIYNEVSKLKQYDSTN